MDTSTLTNARREAILIDMDEQSSILEDKSTASEPSYSSTEDTINKTKTRAGVSNEMDSTVLTPYKESSPNTMERKLAIGSRDLVVGVNGSINELKNEDLPAVPLVDNYFNQRNNQVQARPGNNPPQCDVDDEIVVVSNKDENVEMICNKEEKMKMICNKDRVEADACNKKEDGKVEVICNMDEKGGGSLVRIMGIILQEP